MNHLLHHLIHSARHEESRGNHKLAATAYIVGGFFLAPFLIGIPMMLYGFYKLGK